MAFRIGVNRKFKKLFFLFCFFLFSIQTFIFPETCLFAQDWIVTDNQVVEDTTMVLDGNLIIKDGGSLTLNNVILQINSSFAGQFKVEITTTGSEFIIYNSEITAVNPENPYLFVCRGQLFEMRNSKLSDIGWGDFGEVGYAGAGDKGPFINSAVTIIDSSEFSNNHIGLILSDNSPAVTNCYIHSNNVHGLLLEKTENGQIKNNTIINIEAISLIEIHSGTNNEITGNHLNGEMESSTHGIRLIDSDNNVINQNYFRSYGVGIFMLWMCNGNIITNNNLSSAEIGVEVWGWNNRIENNTISPYLDVLEAPIYMVYAYNSKIINNLINELYNSEGNGIWLRHSSNNLIKGNEIHGKFIDHFQNNSKGILAECSSKKNIFQDNSISNCVRGIVICYSSNENELYNNEISNTLYQSIILDDAYNNNVHSNNKFSNIGRPPFDDGNNNWNYVGNEPIHVLAAKPEFSPIFEKQITGHEIIENQTLYFHYAEIAEGASLTLRNVTLITGVDPNDISYFSLPAGASLSIYNSKILHHEYGNGFTMDPGRGSNFVMKDSELKGAGHEFWYRGIFVMADNVDIENNQFYETTIIFQDCNGGRFVGNKVSHTYTGILFQNNTYNIYVSDNIIDGSMRTAITGHTQNVTIKNNIIRNIWGAGIYSDGWQNCIIEGNTVYNIYEPFPAVEVLGDGNKANSNKIYDSYFGMYDKGVNTEIVNNDISNCDIGFFTLARNQVFPGNIVTNCQIGFQLEGNGNTISGFYIGDCDTGIYVSPEAQNNIIYKNDFINNKYQSIVTTAVNQFDFGGQGNFWSDYTGKDENNDGIGDTPYNVQNETWDNFPLMSPANINIEPIFLNVYSESIIPTSFSAGDTNIVMAKLTINIAQQDSGKSANLLGFSMDRDGSGQDSDIAAIKIWKDYDGDDFFSVNSDSLIGQGVINQGKVHFSFADDQIITFAPTNYFISIDISSTISDIGNSIGFSCQDSTYFVTKFPAKVKNSNFPLVFNQHLLPVEQESSPPLTFSIEQNYPNPFNSGTLISYQIPKPSNVSIQIYNPNGQLIRLLVNQQKKADLYSVYWDGKDDSGSFVASGIYFYKIKVFDFIEVKKMILVQ